MHRALLRTADTLHLLRCSINRAWRMLRLAVGKHRPVAGSANGSYIAEMSIVKYFAVGRFFPQSRPSQPVADDIGSVLS